MQSNRPAKDTLLANDKLHSLFRYAGPLQILSAGGQRPGERGNCCKPVAIRYLGIQIAGFSRLRLTKPRQLSRESMPSIS